MSRLIKRILAIIIAVCMSNTGSKTMAANGSGQAAQQPIGPGAGAKRDWALKDGLSGLVPGVDKLDKAVRLFGKPTYDKVQQEYIFRNEEFRIYANPNSKIIEILIIYPVAADKTIPHNMDEATKMFGKLTCTDIAKGGGDRHYEKDGVDIRTDSSMDPQGVRSIELYIPKYKSRHNIVDFPSATRMDGH